MLALAIRQRYGLRTFVKPPSAKHLDMPVLVCRLWIAVEALDHTIITLPKMIGSEAYLAAMRRYLRFDEWERAVCGDS